MRKSTHQHCQTYLCEDMIDRATIDRIMDATDIVDVISEFVTLHKRGTSYKGLCPFHDDTTPSFSVSPSRGVYKCFACGAAGNAVNFIMKHEQKTYPEALRWLANRYHIEIHDRELTDEERRQATERDSLFLVNEWAAKYFEDTLHNDPDGQAIGLQYFRQRGFRDDIIRRFRLGFCLPGGHAMADVALREGYQKEFLVKSGLCYERDDGSLTDRFAGRVIFPWITISGKVVGFTGRVLDSRTHGVSMKYVNSPDSEIYHKTNELYGINLAKREMGKRSEALLVEGQADVISLNQRGVENVVAGSGTALTKPQIKLIRRFTPNVTLVYDGDEAGQKAALRGTDLLLSEGMNVKVLFLPDGQDPDDFARNRTPEELREFIEKNRTDFIVFEINTLLHGVSDPIRRAEAVNQIVRSIAVIHDPIIRASYLRECAQRTGVREDTLIAQMNRFIYQNKETRQREQQREQARQAPQQRPMEPATPVQQASKVEKMLIEYVIRHGGEVIIRDVEDENTGRHLDLNVAQYIAYDLAQDNLSFAHPLYNRILDEAVQQSETGAFDARTYFLHHPDVEIQALAASLCVDAYQLSDSLKLKESEERLRDTVRHLIMDFRLDYAEQRLKEQEERLKKLSSDSTEEENPEREKELGEVMKEYMKWQNFRNVMAQKLGQNIL